MCNGNMLVKESKIKILFFVENWTQNNNNQNYVHISSGSIQIFEGYSI